MTQLEDWLDDLCVRFIINIPVEELNSIERICFQIEEAQWYYEDFVRPNDPSLPSLSLRPFFNRITQRCPLFASWPQEDMGNAFERFLKYKNRVPVRGAILLNDRMDQVLLVKGYKKNGTWSFPRGKINKDEDDLDCAIREAWEETGFDITAAGLVTDRRKVKSIEKTMRSQNMKLFVFRGVPQDAKFVPQTRKEISKVEWFKLADLPTEKRKNQAEGQAQLLNPNKFYVVAPFMHELKKIIAAERKRDNRQSSKLAQQPLTAESAAAAAAAASAAAALVPQQYPIPFVNNGPLSPAVPSNLPEVTPASAQNPIQHGLHPPNTTASASASDADVKAKSHALLALLQKGSSADMRNVPYAPLEQTTGAAQPHSPERPITSSYPRADMLQSPLPFDLYPAAHPAAPPPSALPQLNEHTRSLLDAFSRPSAAPAEASNPLSPAQQNLLAAFTSPRAAPQSTRSPGNNAGDNLLQLLKMNQLADAHPGAPQSNQQLPTERHPSIIPATEHTSQPVPAESNASALLGLLQQKPQPTVPDAQIPKSYAAAAGTPAQVSQTTATKPRQSPVELSATTNDEPKVPNTDKTKANLLSLLGSMSSKKPQHVGGKSRSGTTSATLDRPFDEPQFDAIAKTPTFNEEPKRNPVAGHRKLFDPKQDQVKQMPNVKVLAPKDDRSKQPKSPRTVRHQQGKSQRPVTPKEVQKQFQPQILKRPQLPEGEGPLGLPALLTKTAATEQKTSATVSPLSTLPSAASLPSSAVVPEAATPIRLADVFSNQSAVPHDPQREALLSLLKTPSQQPVAPDANATPKASTMDFVPPPQEQPERIVSPPAASQLASPVMDGEEGSAPRSRVSSLASLSNSGGRWPTEKRQTAPGDKAFLLNFLKGMAAETS